MINVTELIINVTKLIWAGKLAIGGTNTPIRLEFKYVFGHYAIPFFVDIDCIRTNLRESVKNAIFLFFF